MGGYSPQEAWQWQLRGGGACSPGVVAKPQTLAWRVRASRHASHASHAYLVEWRCIWDINHFMPRTYSFLLTWSGLLMDW